MEKMNNYLEQLAEARIQPDVLQHALDILQAVPQIQDELENPTVPHEKKEDIIRKIFPEKVRNFTVQPKGHGIGIKNIYERLRITYKKFDFTIDSEEGKGTAIRIRVPKQKAGE